MRGARRRSARAACWRGIIPADAGSTIGLCVRIIDSQDHPRGCGEHDHPVGSAERPRGSSPRMRGALLLKHLLRVLVRIIPADAGSTTAGLHTFRQSWDHPRGCGEHWTAWHCVVPSGGSSPRMRGALEVVFLIGIIHRIIPADAGSTEDGYAFLSSPQDHPRGCGEHTPL